MTTMIKMTYSAVLAEMIAADPISQFLANGGSWADAAEMEERVMEERRAVEAAERLERAVEAIPKWRAQLEATVRKGSKTPSALKHKARLLESLREAYAHAGRDPNTANAFLGELEAGVAAGAVAKPAKGGAPKGKWGALAGSDSE